MPIYRPCLILKWQLDTDVHRKILMIYTDIFFSLFTEMESLVLSNSVKILNNLWESVLKCFSRLINKK